MQVERLGRVLGQYAYRYADEIQLQDRIAVALAEHGYEFERERRIDDRNRFDFFVAGGLVIEVKVDGSLSEALRQMVRYCELPDVNAVLLASTKAWADFQVSEEVRRNGWYGKPFAVVRLRRQAL